MTKKDKQKEAEAMYEEYIVKLKALKEEQTKIVNEFIAEIEKKKLEKIRKEL